MKKQYISPSSTSCRLQMMQIICASKVGVIKGSFDQEGQVY